MRNDADVVYRKKSEKKSKQNPWRRAPPGVAAVGTILPGVLNSTAGLNSEMPRLPAAVPRTLS